MQTVTPTLTEKQAQTLAGLISLGVSALGAQIAQGGIQALKAGAEQLALADEIVEVLNAALEDAAAKAKAEAEKKDKAA